MRDYDNYVDEETKASSDYIKYITEVLGNRISCGQAGVLTNEEWNDIARPEIKKKITYNKYKQNYSDPSNLIEILDIPIKPSRIEKEEKKESVWDLPLDHIPPVWSKLNIESKITIIIGVIGLILSFLTLITR